MAKNSFGQKLKQIRKAKNLTQAQLAELAGANEKHISKIETGVYFPTFNTLEKLLNALDLTIEDVGVELNNDKLKSNNTFYEKSILILKSAKNEQEQEYYYGLLEQAQKGINILNSK